MNSAIDMPVAARACESCRTTSGNSGAVLFLRIDTPASNSRRLLAGIVQLACVRLIGP